MATTISGVFGGSRANNGNRRQRQDDDFVPADVFLNVGANVVFTDETSGEENEKYVSLPKGLAVDTMEPREISPRNTEEFNTGLMEQNMLLEMLQEQAKQLKPGESVRFTLVGELHRRKEAAVQNPGVSPVITAMRGMKLVG